MAKMVRYGGLIDHSDKKGIRQVLGGEVSALMSCLHWYRTPQGSQHWAEVYWGDKRLSKRSRQYLNKLLNL